MWHQIDVHIENMISVRIIIRKGTIRLNVVNVSPFLTPSSLHRNFLTTTHWQIWQIFGPLNVAFSCHLEITQNRVEDK